jgi:hypothetical protein
MPDTIDTPMSRQTSLPKNSLPSVLPHGRYIRTALLWLTLICAGNVHAEVYQNTDTWVAERLQLDTAPAPQILWVTPDVRVQVTRILGHAPRIARYRYWRAGERTLWVLDEVGKTEDITFGFDIDSDQIQHSKVLAFRETRGWEIRAPWFTRQFDGARLTPELQLSQSVHVITGATLSVDAFRRSARLALYLHQQVTS